MITDCFKEVGFYRKLSKNVNELFRLIQELFTISERRSSIIHPVSMGSVAKDAELERRTG